jgi:hypothetical protein
MTVQSGMLLRIAISLTRKRKKEYIYIYIYTHIYSMGPRSAVSIASDHGLDDRGVRVRDPVG